MAVKCRMPNCRSYTNSGSGLCGYHEQKAIEFEYASDAEQRTPEDRARVKLWHAQTFEKFTAQGEQRRREERERKERYRQQKQREFEQRKQEHERKKREWQERQREKISRLERAIAGLRESVSRDSSHLEDLKRKHDNVRPGRNASEIYRNINKKMEEVANRRWDKQRKLSEMESSLADMKSELSRSFS